MLGFKKGQGLAYSVGVISWVMVLAIASAGCGAPKMDIDSLAGRVAIIDAARIALNKGNCTRAIDIIDPLYDSAYTNNEVRMLRASAYACLAGIDNFFGLVSTIGSNSSKFSGNSFWAYMTELFYNSVTNTQDLRIYGTWNAMDALQAAITPGTIIVPSNQINAGSRNVGSLLTTDRVDDSNLYMALVAMAGMGNIQTRYGAPTAAFGRGQILGVTAANAAGWTSAAQVDETACSYGASVVSFFDSINSVVTLVNGGLNTSLSAALSTFNTVIGQACNAGCRGTILNGVNYNVTGCAFADDLCLGTGTMACPSELRDRTSCTGQVTNRASCAAAGIANFVSRDILGWQ